MRVLVPTGRQSEAVLRAALARVDDISFEIVVTGEIASFLTPAALEKLLRERDADCAVVSGMCTASFSDVEASCGIPVFLGTRHAADMALAVPLLKAGKLSRTMAADFLLTMEKQKEAERRLIEIEDKSDAAFSIRGVKIGCGAPVKIIYEIMDAPSVSNLRARADAAFASGADIVDLGFGFDATEQDVIRCFSELADVSGALSIDTLNPDLIRAGLFRADLIFSLTDETLPLLAEDVKKSGAAAVLISRSGAPLEDIVKTAKAAGLTKVFADPVLQPPLSGMVSSLAAYEKEYGCPKVLGCVNVIELMDADSPGICAMLAAAAAETNCAALLISEHSDKTRGCISEMRRAVSMMTLSRGRPYPKDTAINGLILKEKRMRREPALVYDEIRDAAAASEKLDYDPKGNFRIGIEDGWIVAVRHKKAIRGKNWYDVFSAVLDEEGVSLLDHAAYLGKELYKAELALKFGRSFEQDGEF
ncbi:MAG TPA: dihydropteroate synthase-like protein [Methanocorpusculum sp.]|nr:dihydropteroate synthase-like protein [Methanocorpusculum sp.]